MATATAGFQAYRVGLLDPRRTRPASCGLDPESTFGVEVTAPELTQLCGLGNLDPQHTGGDASMAAIEAAVTHPLPPRGSLLVTVRPDVDAFGAMAVLDIRACEGLPQEAAARIEQVALADRFAAGPWPSRRDETTAAGDVDAVTPVEVLASVTFDAGVPVEQRAAAVRRWLATGQLPEDAQERAVRIAGERAEAERQTELRELAADGTIAVVRGTHRFGLSIGYRYAPVVVAENPTFRLQGGRPHRKLTVAQYDDSWVDLGAVVEELSVVEPGWGGSPTICGSPQGDPCVLATGEVVALVERHLRSRVAGGAENDVGDDG